MSLNIEEIRSRYKRRETLKSNDYLTLCEAIAYFNKAEQTTINRLSNYQSAWSLFKKLLLRNVKCQEEFDLTCERIVSILSKEANQCHIKHDYVKYDKLCNSIEKSYNGDATELRETCKKRDISYQNKFISYVQQEKYEKAYEVFFFLNFNYTKYAPEFKIFFIWFEEHKRDTLDKETADEFGTYDYYFKSDTERKTAEGMFLSTYSLAYRFLKAKQYEEALKYFTTLYKARYDVLKEIEICTSHIQIYKKK